MPEPLCSRSGKIIYETPGEARKTLKRLKQRGRDDLKIYQCEFCSKWHHGRLKSPAPRRSQGAKHA